MKKAQTVTRRIVFLVLALAAVTPAVSSAQAPEAESWYPSRYDAGDTIGAANNLSPDIVAAAAGLVDRGKVYSLAVVTSEESPDPYAHFYQVRAYPMTPSEIGPNRFTVNESVIITHDGLGTTIDGFGHAGMGRRYYNGVGELEVFPHNGSGTLLYGMEQVPPIVSRGVLLDMAGYLGVEFAAAGTEFNSKEIAGVAARQGLEIRKGDVVLLHTGWLPKLWSDTQTYLKTQPGLGVDGARYLIDRGIVLVGIDARTIEAHPATYVEPVPVHQELLTKNGVWIIEHLDTRALHADGVGEFLFVLGIPRLRGTVQGIVHPIALK